MGEFRDDNGKISRAGKFAIVTYAVFGALFIISVINHFSAKPSESSQKLKSVQEEKK